MLTSQVIRDRRPIPHRKRIPTDASLFDQLRPCRQFAWERHVDREIEEDILRALRRITRAIDIHSRRLVNTYGLTGPQLLCLRTLNNAGTTTLGRLADELALSQSTITGIVDRLEARQLVARERSADDRRKVTVSLTDAGQALVLQAPSPLQESLVTELRKLDVASQTRIRDTLTHVVAMMGGSGLDAAPVLSSTPVTQPLEDAPPKAPPSAVRHSVVPARRRGRPKGESTDT